MENLNFKELNERLESYMDDVQPITEISQETKDAVVAKRREQSQIAADKYARAAALARNSKVAKDKAELQALKDKQPTETHIMEVMKDIVTDISKEVKDSIYKITPVAYNKKLIEFAIFPASSRDEDVMELLKIVTKIVRAAAQDLTLDVSVTEGNDIIVVCKNVPKKDKDLDTIIKEIKQCSYKGGESIDNIVCENLDKFSHEELIKIVEDGRKMTGYNGLFPSGWSHRNKTEKYPVELAKAISDSKENEDITDIYNVYYRRDNTEIFRDAIEIWQHSILNNMKRYEDYIAQFDDYGFSQVKDMYDIINGDYKEFIDELYASHSSEIADKILNA